MGLLNDNNQPICPNPRLAWICKEERKRRTRSIMVVAGIIIAAIGLALLIMLGHCS